MATKNPNQRPGSPASPVYLPTCSADIYKYLKNPTATMVLGVIMSNINFCSKKYDDHHRMYAGLPVFRVTESYLAEQIGCSVPTISKCLKLLMEHELIMDIRNGNQRIFPEYGLLHNHCITPAPLCYNYYYDIKNAIDAWMEAHPTGYWTRKPKSRDEEAAQEEAADPEELRAAQALLQYKDAPAPKQKPKFSGVPEPQISAAAPLESDQEAGAEEEPDEDYEEQEPEEVEEEYEEPEPEPEEEPEEVAYGNFTNWSIQGPDDGLPF